MERLFIQENARERERLRALVARLSDDELSLPLGDGWTIAAALAHLAFWDQRSLVLTRNWKRTGVLNVDDANLDVTNDALLPLCLAMAPRAAAALAISSAEAIDRELEEAPAEFISAMENAGVRWRLYRSVHRETHLGQIEAVLRSRDQGRAGERLVVKESDPLSS
jgi:hypothetical protein